MKITSFVVFEPSRWPAYRVGSAKKLAARLLSRDTSVIQFVAPRNDMLRKQLAAVIILQLVLTVVGIANASAQGRTLWLASDEGSEQSIIEDTLNILLANRIEQHIVGVGGLAERLEATPISVPACFDGRGTCVSIENAVASAIGVRQIVAIKVITRSEEGASVECAVRSPDATQERVITAEAGALRAALLECVGAITEGRGRLVVDSQPSQSPVAIDDEPAGLTPVTRTLGVGTHVIEIEREGYHTVRKIVEIRPGAVTEEHVEMERSVAIMLVRSATPGAMVTLDGGNESHEVGTEVFVEPGAHTVVISAPGYAPIEREIEFAEGERVELRAALSLSQEEITRRERERILGRPLMIQAGIHFSRFHTDWSGADVDGTTPSTAITCAIRPTTGDCDRPPVTAFGLHLEIAYAWKALEVLPIGVGYRLLAMNDRGTDYRLDDGQLRLSHKRAHRWNVRIAHVGARWLIDEYWEPYARGGFTINFDGGAAEDLQGDTGTYKFSRRGLELELRAGSRFHVNSLLYGYAEALVAFELIRDGTRPTWGLAAGAGINLPTPFVRRERGQDSPPSDVPELVDDSSSETTEPAPLPGSEL